MRERSVSELPNQTEGIGSLGLALHLNHINLKRATINTTLLGNCTAFVLFPDGDSDTRSGDAFERAFAEADVKEDFAAGFASDEDPLLCDHVGATRRCTA